MTAIGRFVGTVALAVYHPASTTYLVLRRSDRVDVGRGEWEVVTGRVHQGESFEQAALREAQEELGVAIRLDFLVGTAHFYRGTPVSENEALGVRYACSLDSREAIQLSSEHDAHRWMTPEQISNWLPGSHRVRRFVERAEQLRAVLTPDVIALQQREGFLSDE
ncbi:MAG: NUDIX domain-containing protein [Chloroflexi bacterium]|nr:NUDIX domain-containing protein [Chloroflexota bacterium]MDA1147677.1 NUDIX domain-containing protein [Chloroflexota bacterium]